MAKELSVESGCDVAPDCLDCWLPKCKHEIPNYSKPMLQNLRIAALRDKGVSIDDIAEMFGISRRSVLRRTAKARLVQVDL